MKDRKWIITPLMVVLFLLGFSLAVLYFAPLANCAWCDGEIKAQRRPEAALRRPQRGL